MFLFNRFWFFETKTNFAVHILSSIFGFFFFSTGYIKYKKEIGVERWRAFLNWICQRFVWFFLPGVIVLISQFIRQARLLQWHKWPFRSGPWFSIIGGNLQCGGPTRWNDGPAAIVSVTNPAMMKAFIFPILRIAFYYSYWTRFASLFPLNQLQKRKLQIIPFTVVHYLSVTFFFHSCSLNFKYKIRTKGGWGWCNSEYVNNDGKLTMRTAGMGLRVAIKRHVCESHPKTKASKSISIPVARYDWACVRVGN